MGSTRSGSSALVRRWEWPLLLALVLAAVSPASSFASVQTNDAADVAWTMGGGWDTPPAIADGVIVAGGEDRHLYAFDADDGDQVWRVSLRDMVLPGASLNDAPLIVDDVVVILASDTLVGLDMDDGEELWREGSGGLALTGAADDVVFLFANDTLQAIEPDTGDAAWESSVDGFDFPNALQASDDLVLLADSDGQIFAFDAESGDELWRLRGDAAFVGMAATEDVVVVNTGTAIIALDPGDGEERWREEPTQEPIGSPVLTGDVAVVASSRGSIEAYDTESGEERWSASEPPVNGGPWIAADDDRIYVAGSVGPGANMSTLTALDPESGETLWSSEDAPTGPLSANSPFAGGLVTADEIVALASKGGLLIFDSRTGETDWRLPTIGSLLGGENDDDRQPVVDDDTVYAASQDGSLHALDLASGEIQWSTPLSGQLVSGPEIEDDRLILVAGSDIRSYAASDGDEDWSTKLPGDIAGDVVVAEGEVYVAAAEGDDWSLVALDAESGDERWTTPVDVIPTEVLALSDDLILVTGSADVIAFERDGGSEVWRYTIAAETYYPPVVAGETALIVARDGSVIALGLNDGEAEWTTSTDEFIGDAPAVDDELAYLGADGGILIALDLATGDEEWRAEPDDAGGFFARPTVSDDTIYVADTFGLLFAIEPGSGETLWQSSLEIDNPGAVLVSPSALTVIAETTLMSLDRP